MPKRIKRNVTIEPEPLVIRVDPHSGALTKASGAGFLCELRCSALAPPCGNLPVRMRSDGTTRLWLPPERAEVGRRFRLRSPSSAWNPEPMLVESWVVTRVRAPQRIDHPERIEF